MNCSSGSVLNKCLCYSDDSDPSRRHVLPLTEHQPLNDPSTQWRKEVLCNLGAWDKPPLLRVTKRMTGIHKNKIVKLEPDVWKICTYIFMYNYLFKEPDQH